MNATNNAMNNALNSDLKRSVSQHDDAGMRPASHLRAATP
jgi:hypothetical protein